jgi:carboxymethylenebutenolidase
VVGYCVGGSVAWLAAQELDIAAAVSYYGRDVVDFLDRPPRCPVMLHFGERDHLIPVADVQRIRNAYPAIPTYVYVAGHGFDREGGDAAALARERTLQLLQHEL